MFITRPIFDDTPLRLYLCHRYELLMEGAQEPSAFLQWQKEMRKKDLQQEQARTERRRLEGLMSHKEAAIAPARIMERNQKAAQLHKEEVLLTQQLIQQGISCVTIEGPYKFLLYGTENSAFKILCC